MSNPQMFSLAYPQCNVYNHRRLSAAKEKFGNLVSGATELGVYSAATYGVIQASKNKTFMEKFNKFLARFIKPQDASGSPVKVIIEKVGKGIEYLTKKTPAIIKDYANKIVNKSADLTKYINKIKSGGTAAKGKAGLVVAGLTLLAGGVLNTITKHLKKDGAIEQKYQIN